MAQSNKLGTFGGVFTPSILTILGVILFLRLPWIVGQAGLWLTIGIILLAHLVSVTSGLSVSSIATDKKVKAGGTYYIISRSLGLPIGGTLGVALFVGRSFSVSLYLIGFSESFLGFLNLQTTPTNIRIAGTIALICVTTLTFISTSLAIRTQYFIMAVIGLSLASIFLGSSALSPAAPHLAPVEGMAPFIVLFAIFFPAVTGFEAGVSMSGDLRDPKRSLPMGTIAAIIVGLVIYISLAVFFAFQVEADALITNPNILLELSLFAPAVVAGIWGATISSAIGSILGAPRILQATSTDGITPRTFARGYGRTNEPRNAALLVFAFAEAGILIGELDVIARIVSMFFITTYGVLNLTCALESWASTDFRPSFRVPTWISVVGAVTCFVIMIQLDILATLGAVVVLAGIYAYLKRRELRLESGDTWEGVWSSLVRASLQRLNNVMTHSRNWRPNIILFSGGTEARPYLLEFGRWLVRKRGVLSNFDLLEQTRADIVFPKMRQSVRTSDEDVPGVFSRRLECADVYESIETVAQVYGFSGLDPNAVMLGWARNSRDPRRFGLLIRRLTQLDYNVLLLDYDIERGFGRQERIDIWWGGGNNNITLSLAMLKCLLMTDEWSEASVRLLTVISNTAETNRVHRNMLQLLDDQRINGTVKLINNSVERLPFETIIAVESVDADLIIFGMPEVDEHNAQDFVASTNTYLDGVGSVLLVHASSSFEAPSIGVETEGSTVSAAGDTALDEDANATSGPDITDSRPARAPLLDTIVRLRSQSDRALRQYLKAVADSRHTNVEIVDSLGALAERNFDALRKYWSVADGPRARRGLARVRSDFLFHSRSLLERYQTELLPAQQGNLDAGLEQLLADLETLLSRTPDEVGVPYEEADLQRDASDSLRLGVRKSYERIRHRALKRPIEVRAHLKPLMRFHFETALLKAVYRELEVYGIQQYQFVSDVQKCLHGVADSLGIIERTFEDKPDVALIEQEFAKTHEALEHMGSQLRQQGSQCSRDLLSDSHHMMLSLYGELTSLDIDRRVRKRHRLSRLSRELKSRVLEVPELWKKNQWFVINFGLIDASLMAFENRLNTISAKLRAELTLDVENNVLNPLADLQATLTVLQTAPAGARSEVHFPGIPETNLGGQGRLDGLTEDLQAAIDDIPETIEIIGEESFQTIDRQQYEEVQTLVVSLRRLIDYLTESELIDPLRQEMTALPVQARKAVSAARDVSRLLSLNLTEGADGEVAAQDASAALPADLDIAIHRLEEERTEIIDALRTIDGIVETRLRVLSGKLNAYLVSRLAANLGHYIRTEESRKMLSGVVNRGERIRAHLVKGMVSVLYRRSEGVLAARKLKKTESARPPQVDSMLSLVEALSPRPGVLKMLPSYYRQLFLGRQPIGTEFLVPRTAEFEEAERAIRRYQEGRGGGLLVLADPSGGKRTFCNSIVDKYLPRHNVYHVFPPAEGSIDPGVFRTHLRDAIRPGNADEPRALPEGSVIIVDELERWWERSPDGMAVVDELVELINQDGEHCLFIVNAVASSFRFINRVRPIDHAFLGIVECKPFDAEDLQRAVLLRHRPSGLKFELDGRAEDETSDLRLAILFNAYFDFTAGSVGITLGSWIANINRVEKDRIVIRSPEVPDLAPLSQLEPHLLVWLQSLVLHRSMTVDQIARLFRISEREVARYTAVLRRTGMIVERKSGVLEINPYLEPFVIRELQRMDRP